MTLSARLNLLITAIGTNIKTLFTDLAAHKTATGAHIASKINLDSDVIIPIESDALPETNPSNYTATTVDEAIGAIGTTIRVSKLQKPYTIVPSAASLPATSLGKVIYITADTGTVYFWSTTNSEYISVTGASSSTFPFIAFGFDSETPSQAQALGYLTVSIGHNAGLDNPSNDDINIGTNAGRGVEDGGEGIYVGKDAGWGSHGNRSVILGRNALKGNGLPKGSGATQSVAIGNDAAIGGDLFNSVVIGMQAGILANDTSSVIIGYQSNWGKGSDSCVYIGREVVGAAPPVNNDRAFGAVGIGYKAHPKSRNDVALGSNSTTDEVTTVTPSYVIRGTTYTFANGTTNPTSSVSFGNAVLKRPILNLAAGRISETSTDAVNGSQLHAVITAVNAMGDSGGGGSDQPPLTILPVGDNLPLDGEGTEGTIFVVTELVTFTETVHSWIPLVKVDPGDENTWTGGYWRQVFVPAVDSGQVTVSGPGGGMLIGPDPYSGVRYDYLQPALQALQNYIKSVDVVYWTTSTEIQGLVNIPNIAKQNCLYVCRDTAEIYIYEEVTPGSLTYAFKKLNEPVPGDGGASTDGNVINVSSFAVGDILYTARDAPGPSWLPCNGAIHLPENYPALSSILGVEDAVGEWNELAGAPTGIKRIAFANGRFVGLGDNIAAMSLNGITWSTSYVDSVYWAAIAYGSGVFVAVNQANTIATSTDGVTWNVVAAPDGVSWRGLAYGNGKFVISRESNSNTATSTDGINWTVHTAAAPGRLRNIAYGNGVFLGVIDSYTRIVGISVDGITWTTGMKSDDAACQAITYGNGKFVIVADNHTKTYSSPDGVVWTDGATAIPATSWRHVTFANGRFIATNTSNSITLTSVDGSTWTEAVMDPSTASEGIAFGNGRFITVRHLGMSYYLHSAIFKTPLIATVGKIKAFIKAYATTTSVNVSTDSNIDGGEPSTVYGGTLLVDGGTP